jgi:hypothetical protein
MTNAEIPIGRQAARAWKRLDASVRKDVWRRAPYGVGHPDPSVAAIAIGRARYTLSGSFAVRYWGRLLVIAAATVGFAGLLDRVMTLGPMIYVIAIVISFSGGVWSYTEVRRHAKQMEQANMNTVTAGHINHGSPD